MREEHDNVDEPITNNIEYVRTKEPIRHGWNFPRIEHVRSKEPVRHVLNLAPKEVVIGDTTLSNIIDRIEAVADSMNALAEELRKTKGNDE